jgi:hypothetical protein
MAGFFTRGARAAQCPGCPAARRKKTGPKAGFLNQRKLIITSLPEQQQQPKQPQQPTKQPKQQPKRQQQRQQQQQRLVQQRQLPELPEQLPGLEQLQLPVPVQQQELLLSCCKQPEQQPSGRRSAGIFS